MHERGFIIWSSGVVYRLKYYSDMVENLVQLQAPLKNPLFTAGFFIVVKGKSIKIDSESLLYRYSVIIVWIT